MENSAKYFVTYIVFVYRHFPLEGKMLAYIHNMPFRHLLPCSVPKLYSVTLEYFVTYIVFVYRHFPLEGKMLA